MVIFPDQFFEEGAKYTQDTVKDLKLENNALISKLEKTQQNAEKYREKIIHLTTAVKDLWVELQTVTSKKTRSIFQQTLLLVMTCERMFMSLLSSCQ